MSNLSGGGGGVGGGVGHISHALPISYLVDTATLREIEEFMQHCMLRKIASSSCGSAEKSNHFEMMKLLGLVQ